MVDEKLYWSNRWKTGQTGWDAGSITTPFIPFIASLKDKNLRILIPGCGNGYEAEYLWRNGFQNVTVVDIAEIPLEQFKNRVPDFPDAQLICADFFELNGEFDLVIEQTFFCAIPPSMRDRYVEKMSKLIIAGGKIAGLLFNFPLTEEGPPYSGSEEEYRLRFGRDFRLDILRQAENSIQPRLGRELWFEFTRK